MKLVEVVVVVVASDFVRRELAPAEAGMVQREVVYLLLGILEMVLVDQPSVPKGK
jgi:hypothetical protein